MKFPHLIFLLVTISMSKDVNKRPKRCLQGSSGHDSSSSSSSEEDNNASYYHKPVSEDKLLNHLATKRPYDDKDKEVKGNGKKRDFLLFQEQGCEAIKLWYFGRHGTRNPGKKDTRDMLEKLPIIRNRIINASESCRGFLSQKELKKLTDWKLSPDVTLQKESHLVKQGRKEMKGIGKRFRKRFPHLFKEIKNTTIRFRSTIKQRTIASSAAFAQGALDTDNVPPFVFDKPTKSDLIIRFYESCTKWLEEVEDQPESIKEMLKFENSWIMNRTVSKISERLGLGLPLHPLLLPINQSLTLTTTEVILMYTTCAFETAWEDGKPSPWCGVFDEEDLQALAYREDLEYYWNDGYGYNVNYEQACKPFEDLVEFLSPNNTLKVRGYFSHSGATLKMLARLGLFKDQTPLRSDDYELVKNTYKWRTSLMDTMATNMAFVLYNCTGNDSTSLQVGFLFQEKPLALPACGNSWMCPLQTFLNGYSSSLDGQCNFNATCNLS